MQILVPVLFTYFLCSIYDLSISSNVNIHIFLIWQKPLQFFETCIPYCIRANMKIPYLLFNSIDYNIDNLVHMNVKERSAKTKLSEIQYTSWMKYICTWAPIFVVTLEMGRMNFCACIQINHETQVMISLSHSFCALVSLNLPHFNALG